MENPYAVAEPVADDGTGRQSRIEYIVEDLQRQLRLGSTAEMAIARIQDIMGPALGDPVVAATLTAMRIDVGYERLVDSIIFYGMSVASISADTIWVRSGVPMGSGNLSRLYRRNSVKLRKLLSGVKWSELPDDRLPGDF